MHHIFLQVLKNRGQRVVVRNTVYVERPAQEPAYAVRGPELECRRYILTLKPISSSIHMVCIIYKLAFVHSRREAEMLGQQLIGGVDFSSQVGKTVYLFVCKEYNAIAGMLTAVPITSITYTLLGDAADSRLAARNLSTYDPSPKPEEPRS